MEKDVNKIVVFPDDFVILEPLLRTSGSNLKFFGGFDQTEVMSKMGKDFAFMSIQFGSRLYYMALNGFHIYTPRKKASSPGSQAIYYARSEDKKEGLLLQYLPPFSKTSRHYHIQKAELFYLIEGKAILTIADMSFHLRKRRGVEKAYKGMIHQIKTIDYPSIVLIKVLGDPEGLSMDDHIYVPE